MDGMAAPGRVSPGLLPAGLAPCAVVPLRWMPSVPRQADERVEDFALRVQEVGRWCGRERDV